MKPQKKREHVKGAWWYIAGILAIVAWCAETGRDPGVIFAFGLVVYSIIGFFMACVVVIALVSGLFGGNGK